MTRPPSSTAAFFAQSRVLAEADVEWCEMGASSSTNGRRYSHGLKLTHRPTGIEVTVESVKPGGRTRKEATEARRALYLEGLVNLEAEVLEARRAANHSATKRHG